MDSRWDVFLPVSLSDKLCILPSVFKDHAQMLTALGKPFLISLYYVVFLHWAPIGTSSELLSHFALSSFVHKSFLLIELSAEKEACLFNL